MGQYYNCLHCFGDWDSGANIALEVRSWVEIEGSVELLKDERVIVRSIAALETPIMSGPMEIRIGGLESEV